MKKAFFLGIMILFTANTAFAGVTGWNLQRNKQGIKVFTQDDPNSSHIRYLAMTTIDAPPAEIANMMRNVSLMPLWIDKSYDVKLIKNIDSGANLIYMKNETPFMVAKRDLVVIQQMIRIDKKHILIEVIGRPEAVEKKSGYVRIPLFNGFWLLSATKDNTTHLVYQGQMDPGGYVPAFFTNMLVVSMPFNTLKKIRKLMKKSYSKNTRFMDTVGLAKWINPKKVIATFDTGS